VNVGAQVFGTRDSTTPDLLPDVCKEFPHLPHPLLKMRQKSAALVMS
jgi:hypothetical protein